MPDPIDPINDERFRFPDWPEIAAIDDPELIKAMRVRAVVERDAIATRIRLLARGAKTPKLDAARSAAGVAERCITALSIRLLELGYESPIAPSYGSISVLGRALDAFRDLTALARSLADDVLKIAEHDGEIPDALITIASYKAGQLKYGIRAMLADIPHTPGKD